MAAFYGPRSDEATIFGKAHAAPPLDDSFEFLPQPSEYTIFRLMHCVLRHPKGGGRFRGRLLIDCRRPEGSPRNRLELRANLRQCSRHHAGFALGTLLIALPRLVGLDGKFLNLSIGRGTARGNGPIAHMALMVANLVACDRPKPTPESIRRLCGTEQMKPLRQDDEHLLDDLG